MVEKQKMMLSMTWNKQLDSFATMAVQAMAGNAKAMALLGMFYDEESADERCCDMRDVIKSISITRSAGCLILEAKLGQRGTFVDACREINENVVESEEEHLAFNVENKTGLLANAEYWYCRAMKVGHGGSADMLAKLKTRNKKRRLHRVLWWIVIGFVMVPVVIPLIFIIVAGLLCLFV